MDGQTDTEVMQTDGQTGRHRGDAGRWTDGQMQADRHTGEGRRIQADTGRQTDGQTGIQAAGQTDGQGVDKWQMGTDGQTDTGQSGRTDGLLGWGG